jgi:hypothetical protein
MRAPLKVSPKLREEFTRLLAAHPRVAIAGGPQTGKTTLAKITTDRPVFHSDDFKSFAWEAVPLAMLAGVAGHKTFVIEGVQVARALRKGLVVDAVIYLHRPRVERIRGQVVMAKGIHTVFAEWRKANRGVPLYVLE